MVPELSNVGLVSNFLKDHPSESEGELALLYKELKASQTFEQRRDLLKKILEPGMNVENCFWLSHAWAESLISGKTISIRNFPYPPHIDIRFDDHEGKGWHLSHGAEPYIHTLKTKGISGDLQPREYKNMCRVENFDDLVKFLIDLQDGQLVLLVEDREDARFGAGGSSHATLAAKINRQIMMIENFAYHPGPKVLPFVKFKEDRSYVTDKLGRSPGFFIYTYPEVINGFDLSPIATKTSDESNSTPSKAADLNTAIKSLFLNG